MRVLIGILSSIAVVENSPIDKYNNIYVINLKAFLSKPLVRLVEIFTDLLVENNLFLMEILKNCIQLLDEM